MKEKQSVRNEPKRYSSHSSPENAPQTVGPTDEWLRLAVESSDTYWWQLDLLTNQPYYSANTERILGQPPAQALEGNLVFVHPDDRAIPAQAFAKALQTGVDQFHYQVRSIALADQVRWFQIAGKILRDEQGKPIMSVGSAQNITSSKLAEQALRQSELKYRTLFNSIDEGFCRIEIIYDADGQAVDYRFLEVNPVFERITAAQNVVGQTARALNSSVEPYWIDAYASVVRTGEPLRFENFHEFTGQWYQVYASRMGGIGSRQVAVVFDDITERKQAEETLRQSEAWLAGQKEAFQAAVTGASLEASLGVLVRMAVEQTGAGFRCAFYVIDQSENGLRHVTGMPDAYSRFVDGIKIGPDSLACGLAVYAGEPVITSDITKDPRWKEWQWLAERFDYRACWSFPIEINERVVGNLAMYWRLPRQTGPRDYAFAAVLTQAAGIIISRSQEAEERSRAEEALRINEERMRLLIESANDFLILTLDARGIINGWSEGARRMLGWRTDEAMGQPVSLIFTPEDQAAGAPEKELQMARRQGRVPDERFYQRKDGSRFYGSGVLSLIGDGSKGFVEIARDITKRKQREENQAFLAEVNEIFAQVSSPEEIMQRVGEKLYVQHELSRLTFAYVNDEAGLITVVYDQHESALPSMLGDQRIIDFVNPDYVREFKSGQLIAINDVMTDPRTMGVRQAYRLFSEGAILLAPLVSDGRWRFTIALHKAQPYGWQPNQTELLSDLTPRLYWALERQRLEDLKRLTLLQQTEALAKIGSWEYNRQSGQLNGSDGMRELFALKPGQLIQPNIYLKAALEDDQNKAQYLVSYLQAGEGHLETDLRIQVGGHIKTLRIKADVIGQGQQQRVVGVDLDITEQLTAQRQIQETAQNLQVVLDGSPAAIGLLKTIQNGTDAGEITGFELAVGNRKLAHFFDKPLEQLLGESAERLSRMLWGEHTLDVLRQVRLTGEARYDEHHLPADGRWLAIATTRQGDGVLVTALDITDLKTIQTQQQRWLDEVEASRHNVDALGELRESLRHRSELLRSVSHDLRSNLGIISGVLKLLSLTDSEAERAQMTEMVMRNVRQATGMLTELLDYSRLEAGQGQRTLERFEVSQLLGELVQSLQPATDEQGLGLVSSGPETLMVEGDRLLTYRIAQNLTTNAIKYTHRGRIIIEWAPDSEGAYWWFSVQDTGPGLDADLVARLNAKGSSQTGSTQPASPFWSVSLGERPLSQANALVGGPGASWTKLRGEGIGLRIVQQLVQLLDAQLLVSSQVGVGTRFTVRFPLRYP